MAGLGPAIHVFGGLPMPPAWSGFFRTLLEA
jgi:hypothetical protein